MLLKEEGERVYTTIHANTHDPLGEGTGEFVFRKHFKLDSDIPHSAYSFYSHLPCHTSKSCRSYAPTAAPVDGMPGGSEKKCHPELDEGLTSWFVGLTMTLIAIHRTIQSPAILRTSTLLAITRYTALKQFTYIVTTGRTICFLLSFT